MTTFLALFLLIYACHSFRNVGMALFLFFCLYSPAHFCLKLILRHHQNWEIGVILKLFYVLKTSCHGSFELFIDVMILGKSVLYSFFLSKKHILFDTKLLQGFQDHWSLCFNAFGRKSITKLVATIMGALVVDRKLVNVQQKSSVKICSWALIVCRAHISELLMGAKR